jgi:hypothetical protein
MSRHRTFVRNLLAALSLLLSSGVILFSTTQAVQAAIAVSLSSVTLAVGNSTTVGVSGMSGSVKLTNSAPEVVGARYSSGVLTIVALRPGTASLKVADSRSSKTVTVTVVKGLAISLSSVTVAVGNSATVVVSNATGSVSLVNATPTVAKATYASGVVTITGLKAGTDAITVKDSYEGKVINVTVTTATTDPGTTPSGKYSLLAWNDLGMHCVDGKDYSVFSILPPYNNLRAQLIDKTTNKVVTTGVTLTYQSLADKTVATTDPHYGSINTRSADKTNFWTWVQALFGASPAPDHGLNLGDPAISNRTPGTTPMQMQAAATGKLFVAEGLPITPVDDNFMTNYYPMVLVSARDASGSLLATARTVLPVSDEMTCRACHATNKTTTNPALLAAKPKAGWVADPNPEKDWKKNILRLHDERKFADPVNKSLYLQALTKVGYSTAGLEATANNGKPVLCAACHSSNALLASGVFGVRALTHALHTLHAHVTDPATNSSLDSSTNRAACYNCHPGSTTQCLRGAMGSPVDAQGNQKMGCQSCHGNMSQVGNVARTGWLQEPNCQSCHHDGIREVQGVDVNGVPRIWADTRFATNPNTPATGYSLYRFSSGHGGLQCEACHGATHAEYPSSHSQDNALSMDLQGYTGPVTECKACHATVPNSANGGPHGMHTIGQAWVSSHGDAAERSGTTACTACHGADYRGSPLSKTRIARSFTKDSKTFSFAAGHNMGCYDCHNGPKGD